MPSGFLGGGIGPVALKRRRAAGNGLLNNLIAYWPLNEAGGANNALDLHSNALHLTQNSSPGADTGKVYATARTFNGTSQYFSRASEALLQTGDVDFTIAAWVYLSSKNTFAFAIAQDGAGNSAGDRVYSIVYDQPHDRYTANVFIATDSIKTATANTYGSPALNSWTLLIAWHDASGDTINISANNGTADSAATEGSLQSASNTPVTVARRFSSTVPGYWTGRIGPVAMWKSAPGGGGVLSEAQRTALYNGGAGLAYADFTA